ncbi:MAG: nucleotidyltransferase domain-containing protein [archaeon]
MSLTKKLKGIKKFLKKRYGDNLAAILVFGSANTGQYKEGVSDIDLIILLKRENHLNLKKEFKKIVNELKELKVSLHHLKTIKGHEKYIYQRGSWSSWTETIKESKNIYSTQEFRKLKTRLIKKPISKQKLIEYSNYKNRRMSNYPGNRKGFSLTKGVFANLKTRMQTRVYLKHKTIIFDYNKCIKKINLEKEERKMLKRILKKHEQRKIITNKEFQYYKKLITNLTKEMSQ